MILVHQIVILSPLLPTKLTNTKIYHLISLRFEQFEQKKSQCDVHRPFYRKCVWRLYENVLPLSFQLQESEYWGFPMRYCLFLNYYQWAGPGLYPTWTLGVQLTLYQPRGADYAHYITTCPPRFENITASLIIGYQNLEGDKSITPMLYSLINMMFRTILGSDQANSVKFR